MNAKIVFKSGLVEQSCLSRFILVASYVVTSGLLN